VLVELEIEATKEGSNVDKWVANLGTFGEEEVAEAIMEVQAESLEVTTSILDNINILVERTKESIPSVHVNTNEEQIEEEVVVTGAK
jgi:hypothetical protein